MPSRTAAPHCAARLSRYDIQLRLVKQSRPPYRLRHFTARGDIARREACLVAVGENGRRKEEAREEKKKLGGGGGGRPSRIHR